MTEREIKRECQKCIKAQYKETVAQKNIYIDNFQEGNKTDGTANLVDFHWLGKYGLNSCGLVF